MLTGCSQARDFQASEGSSSDARFQTSPGQWLPRRGVTEVGNGPCGSRGCQPRKEVTDLTSSPLLLEEVSGLVAPSPSIR